MLELSRQDARRLAVRAQLLDAREQDDVLTVVRHLTLLQADPTNAVARNADLVLWSRLGSSFRPLELVSLLEERALVELHGMLRPAEDMALFGAAMAAWPGPGELRDWQVHTRDWVLTNDACRLDVLHRLSVGGPLAVSDLPDTCAVPWTSSGWTHGKNVQKLLDLLVVRGEVAMAGRRGRERLWDLAERVYPDHPLVPLAEADRQRRERRLRSLGIARQKAPELPGEPADVGEVGEPAVVEGVKGTWRVDPAQLGQPFHGRVAVLSPLDRLVLDRVRLAEIFGFDYQLEMYKPAAKRRWGYWAMPVLVGDRLVGKVDAAADRKAEVLRVAAVHEDDPWDDGTRELVRLELLDLARWLELDLHLVDGPGGSDG